MAIQVSKHSSKFGKELRTFLQQILRQQILIVENGNAEHNESPLRELITKYKAYTAYNFTDMGAAVFIKKHYNNLLMLIPSHQASTRLKLADMANKSDIYFIH